MQRSVFFTQWVRRCTWLGLVLFVLTACGGNAAPDFPNLLWTYDAQDADLQLSVPVVADGVVYVTSQAATEGHSGHLVALDEATGAVKWDVTNENLTMLPPVVSGDRVLVVERSGGQRVLIAVDAANGQELWRSPAIRGTPVATADAVWLIANDNNVLALALTDGRELFKRPVSSDTAAALIIHEGVVYVGDPDGLLLALNATDGDLLWQAAAEPRGYYNPPTVGDDLVFLDAPLTAYDRQSGEVRWTAQRSTDGNTPVLFDDTLYVSGFPDTEMLYALDAATGAEKWSFNAVGSDTFRGTAWLAKEGATLFALGKNDLYALDVATGAVKWQYNLKRYPEEDCLVEFLGGPVVLAGVVFANIGSDRLSYSCSGEFTSQLRLDAATGQLLGETKSEEALFTHPEVLFGLSVNNERLYQRAAGKLYVMKAR